MHEDNSISASLTTDSASEAVHPSIVGLNSVLGIQMSSEQQTTLLDKLYREILDRPADNGGIETYTRVLQEFNVDAAVPKIVRSLLKSPEYLSKSSQNAHLLLDKISGKGSRTINGRKVSHIISLGTHCLTGFYLKKYGMKRYSLPLDWLFSSPETVLHCFRDDFRTFLDRENYTSITKQRGSNEPGANHQFYLEEHGVKDMFAHRDPCSIEDYQYFVAGVDRFRALKRNNEGKLFFMIVRPEYDASKHYAALADCIDALMPNSVFICVQLRVATGQVACHSMRCVEKSTDHAFYEFQPSSTEMGLGFEDPIDDLALMRLIREFDFDLSPHI